jgi:hypothetical protein
MSEPKNVSGPQFRADRAVEQEAVRTTIVGGRPPGSGQRTGDIPRGIEVLVKKASVDPAFKELLLAKRADAAAEIGLKLDPAEALMLAAAPAEQLQAIIAQTSVPQEHRRAFLGQAAATMLAALGVVVTVTGCPKGSRPDLPRQLEPPERGDPPERSEPSKPPQRPERPEPTKGIKPDRPPGVEPPEKAAVRDPLGEDVRPERIPVTDGIRPDRPRPPDPNP